MNAVKVWFNYSCKDPVTKALFFVWVGLGLNILWNNWKSISTFF